jgi:hypothetical protein
LEFGVSNETFAAYDISVSGIGLKGSAPIPIGSDVILSVGSVKLRARIVRFTEKGFALEFEPTLNNRAKIIRHIFAKPYLWAGRTIEPVKVALAIATKLVR